MLHPSVAVLEYNLTAYRRVWRASVLSSFALPILFLLGMGVSVAFVTRLSDLVLGSIERTLPGSSSLIYTRPGEGFAFYFDISLMVGVVLAAPFVSYQVWRFIAPGLHARVSQLLDEQLRSASEWRDQINTYFLRKSGIPDAHGRTIHA